MEATPRHPLRSVLTAAARAEFPPVDGLVEVFPPGPDGTWAIVAFTGHAFVLSAHPPDHPVFVGIDAFGGATDPRFILDVAGPGATIGSLDLVMVRGGGSGGHPLPITVDHDAHPRVIRARNHRRDVRVFGDERGLVTVGRGLVGRTELSVEVVSGHHGAGVGRSLVLGALAELEAEESVFAQVAPGNAASVRVFLACGFVPIGSEILITPGDTADRSSTGSSVEERDDRVRRRQFGEVDRIADRQFVVDPQDLGRA